MTLTRTDQVGPAVSAGPTPARRSTRPSRSRRRKHLEIALFVGPATLVYVGFVLIPVVLAAVYSLYKWNGFGPLTDFNFPDNYVRALTDPVFVGAIGHNLFIVVLSLVIQGPIAIGIALLLNRRMRGRTLLRVIIFIPYVLSEVIAGLSWKLLLQPDGPFDAFLSTIGLGGFTKLWLADSDIVLWTMFWILTWKYIGFAIILFLAGLQGVPEELSEAAAIDGASWWQIQRHITIPLLGPTIRIWAFLSIIGSLQLFDMVWVVTGGGPAGATATMATYMVQFGFQRNQLGFGSAVAVILFIVSLIFALVYQRFVLRRDLAGSLTQGVG
ncbi:carbohydrate ABC transporter permease [Leifsonia sp. Leaf264]|uniref:carbohydrate ABC transporter permease n=1 Tax=Leifsonia sp. Leaf264 TaxID=1736314 RepID=UPI00070169C9|nr:sugar ABC transporter permease [Leifsonia sp. Leaf264]KQO97063.1 sugar ABC transporter permease [Leifsonia sp. Leaf264]